MTVQRLTIETTDDLHARLERLAQDTASDVGTLAREALERFLDDEEDFARAVRQGIADADAGRVIPGARLYELLRAGRGDEVDAFFSTGKPDRE